MSRRCNIKIFGIVALVMMSVAGLIGCRPQLAASRLAGSFTTRRPDSSQRIWLYVEARAEISEDSLKRLADVSEETEINKPVGVSMDAVLKMSYGTASKKFKDLLLFYNPGLTPGEAFTKQERPVRLFGAPFFSRRIPNTGHSSGSVPLEGCGTGFSCVSTSPTIGFVYLLLKPNYDIDSARALAQSLRQKDSFGLLTVEALQEYRLISSSHVDSADSCENAPTNGAVASSVPLNFPIRSGLDPYISLNGFTFGAARNEVTVAVIDTGITKYKRADGSEDWDSRFTFWNNPEPGDVEDSVGSQCVDDRIGCDLITKTGDVSDQAQSKYFGHGTHVAGLATGFSKEIKLPRSNLQLMVLKVTKPDGGVDPDAISLAIEYAIRNNAQVINVSLQGLPGDHLDFDLSNLGKRQLVVAAAGNDHAPLETIETGFPARFSARYPEHVITVAAVDSEHNLAPCSNFGDRYVTIAAPGVAINSTFPGGGLATRSGTSQAAPLVTLTAALLFGDNPNFSAIGVRNRLEASTDFSGGLVNKVKWGGVLNIRKALSWRDDVVEVLYKSPANGALVSRILVGSIKKFDVKLDPEESPINWSDLAKITFDIDEKHRDRVLTCQGASDSCILQEKQGEVQKPDHIVLELPPQQTIAAATPLPPGVILSLDKNKIVVPVSLIKDIVFKSHG